MSANAAKSGKSLIQEAGSSKTVNLALQQMLQERVERERRGGGVAGGEGAEGAAAAADEEDEEVGVGNEEVDDYDIEEEEAPHDHYAGYDDDEEYGDASDGGGDYEPTY
jgi:hypothetical protein